MTSHMVSQLILLELHVFDLPFCAAGDSSSRLTLSNVDEPSDMRSASFGFTGTGVPFGAFSSSVVDGVSSSPSCSTLSALPCRLKDDVRCVRDLIELVSTASSKLSYR
jgi:hypothetical protein